MKELDKKPLQYSALKLINKYHKLFTRNHPNTKRETGLNPSLLADFLGITKQGLHGALNALYKQGYVKSNRKKEHSSFYLIPTEKGKSIK